MKISYTKRNILLKKIDTLFHSRSLVVRDPDLFPFREEQPTIRLIHKRAPPPSGVGVFFCIGNDSECGMNKPNIIINELDAERLDKLLEQPAYADSAIAAALNDELDRADIVAPEDIPANVVTMNSRIRFIDLSNEKESIRTLVYPASLKDSAEQLSVMAPMGAALLGLSVGTEISWKMPNGDSARIKVLEIIYQPEAAGELHR